MGPKTCLGARIAANSVALRRASTWAESTCAFACAQSSAERRSVHRCLRCFFKHSRSRTQSCACSVWKASDTYTWRRVDRAGRSLLQGPLGGDFRTSAVPIHMPKREAAHINCSGKDHGSLVQTSCALWQSATATDANSLEANVVYLYGVQSQQH